MITVNRPSAVRLSSTVAHRDERSLTEIHESHLQNLLGDQLHVTAYGWGFDGISTESANEIDQRLHNLAIPKDDHDKTTLLKKLQAYKDDLLPCLNGCGRSQSQQVWRALGAVIEKLSVASEAGMPKDANLLSHSPFQVLPQNVPPLLAPEGDLHLQKAETPVIRPLTFTNAREELAKLQANIKEHWPDAPPSSVENKADIDRKDWKRPQRTHQAKWNDRLSDTQFIIKTMQDMLAVMEDFERCSPNKIFGYFVGGEPVGLLLMSNNGFYSDVKYVVAHPGAESIGSTLIETAVQTSAAWRNGGCLTLTPLLGKQGDARQVYLALGFQDHGNDEMHLNPAQSDKWTEHEGKWRLAKGIDSKYIV